MKKLIVAMAAFLLFSAAVLPLSTFAQKKNSDDLPRITTVSRSWKTKYTDISFTNEWLGAKALDGSRCIVLFGALKSNPKQGVAQTVSVDKNGAVWYHKRFFPFRKNGALRVAKVGAKEATMTVVDKRHIEWNFNFYNGFTAFSYKIKVHAER